MSLHLYSVSIAGQMLQRGFWLYIWRIRSRSRVFYYVGRTGDNSSINASSPISRLGQHLSFQSYASANMLIRHMRSNRINPYTCKLEMIALGPIFPEQKTMKQHVHYRDIIGHIESALAIHLRKRGLLVLGKHPRTGDVDRDLLSSIVSKFEKAILKAC